MSLRQCLGRPGELCTVLTADPSGRCMAHQVSATRRVRSRLYADARWWRLRERALATHRARYGEVCPGYQREPHASSRTNPLTADHIVPISVQPDRALDPLNVQVLCRDCNGRKGGTVAVVTMPGRQP